MSLRSVCIAVAAALLGVTSGAAAWQSQLYPKGVDGHYAITPLRFQSRNWALPDFSYTGYMLGAKPPGSSIPCDRIRTVVTTGDFSTQLQTAIDEVGQAGGGTVVIPAGSFTLSRSVGVPYRRVAIVGAGSGRTLLKVPASYVPSDEQGEGAITLGALPGGSRKGWIDKGKVLTRVSQRIAEGDREIGVADGTTVNAGQWIVIQQYYWRGLVRRSDSSGTWKSYDSLSFPPPGAPDPSWSFSYLRQVLSIKGSRLTLDAPIPFTLDPVNNPIGVRSADATETGTSITPREYLGLAGLSLQFADNGNGAAGFPAGIGVYFTGVRNGWMHDVQVLNFPRHGVVVDSSSRISISNSAALRAQNTAGGGRGYGFRMNDSQNVLVRSSYAELARHGFTDTGGLNSMLVWTRNESAGTRVNGDDQHYGLAHQVLWDLHALTYGTGLLLGYRGSDSGDAQESNLSSVVWNASDNGYRGGSYGGLLSLNPAADGYAVVIGGPSSYPVFDDRAEPGSGPQMAAGSGLQAGPSAEAQSPGSRDRNVLYEGLYRSGLAPASLWEQQTRERLGSVPGVYSSSACVPAAAAGSVPRATWTGAGELVFNGDQLGYAVEFDAGCPDSMEGAGLSTSAAKCRVNSRTRNATAGGAFSMALLPSSVPRTVIAHLGGPSRSTQAFTRLTFKVYPTGGGLSFDLALRRRAHALSDQDVTLGYRTIGPLVADQWNSVSLPMSAFPSGDFDTITLVSRGGDSHVQAWLDDMLLQ